MKQILVAAFLVVLAMTCAKKNENTAVTAGDSISDSINKDSVVVLPTDDKAVTSQMRSAYDYDLAHLESHQEDLKELSDSNVFSKIHEKIITTQSKNHQDFFASRPNYELLYSINGDLFGNEKNDCAFIVFDKKNTRISILMFDEAKGSYQELFRDIKVVNGLEGIECDYYAYGTLDYQIADNLIYQRSDLLRSPDYYLEYFKCKITDISKDEDIILADGCIAKGFNARTNRSSFCIPTSTVYNNWECLQYDREKDVFTVFYGQAFAD